ncbi:MAG: hypothetical protein HDS65_02775 [Bacteroidales bacterium]|nr:hypothetical protein [Bacteroidales bacterium]
MKLTDPAATAGTALAVKRNHLYRIIITKATKLNFDIKVADWEEEEPYVAADIKLNLDPDEQKELNDALLVSRFSEYNVKAISKDNVEFFDHQLSNYSELEPSHYFSYTNLKNMGLIENGNSLSVSDSEGNSYHVPTLGEITLLYPCDLRLISDTGDVINGYKVYNNIQLTTGRAARYINPNIFDEEIFLKNNSKGQQEKSEPLTNEVTQNGFKGTSQIAAGRYRNDNFIYYNINDKSITSDNSNDGDLITYPPIYGVRFLGTSQRAAYRWQNIPYGKDNQMRALSIRIKALKDDNVILNDIVDNHSFWAEDYIEYVCPYYGYFSSTSNDIAGTSLEASYVTTTINTTSIYRLQMSYIQVQPLYAGLNSLHNLRLIKDVKEVENAE